MNQHLIQDEPLHADHEYRERKYSTIKIGNTGLMLIQFPRFVDARGSFMETWSYSTYERLGLPILWLQDNISHSRKGVLRGMHIQRVNPQGKLIHVISGAIQDVAVDVRPNSPTRGKHYSVVLRSHPDFAQFFYVPPGFAHGFLALEESIVSYKCTSEYVQTADGGLHPLGCGVSWIVDREQDWYGRISLKDQALPSLMDYLQKDE